MNRFFAFLLLVVSASSLLSEKSEEIKVSDSFSNPHIIISHINYEEINLRKFSKNLEERYVSNDFKYEQIVHHNSQWEEFKQWFIGVLRDLFNIQDKNMASNWFDYLINFISIFLILAVVFFIVKAILKKEGNWFFSRSEEDYTIDHTISEEKLDQSNFGELIKDAKKKNDYRLVIRYYYLWLLQKLAQNSHIEWDANKTNSDYQYEIKDKKLRNRFSYSCYLYDYIWYGEFKLDQEKFLYAESNFKNTIENI